MVSTRGVKFNFSEGERVLCYEPDPNKAKVLYDSKILECCIGRDSNTGRKCAEYLVHFYGWNSSWDRYVVEENIVKDNSENRQLQRKLAEQAAQGLKGKKLKLNKIPAIIKEIVVSSNCNNSTSVMGSNEEINKSDSLNLIQPKKEFEDGEVNIEENEDEDVNDNDDDEFSNFDQPISFCQTSNSEGTDGNDNGSESNQNEDQQSNLLFYNLNLQLKQILDNDYLYIVANKHQYQLPLKPNVEEIISNFDMTNNCSNNSQLDYKQLIGEFNNSIEIYFNTLITHNYLFYNDLEQQNYLRYLQSSPEIPPTKIFGFVHLLRFLVTLPEFLSNTNGMSKKQLKTVTKLIQHFIKYLNNNKEKFCHF